MGHQVNRTTGESMGGYQAVLFQRDDPHATASNGGGTNGVPPVNGVYRAASDFRKDGQAVGW